MIEVISHTKGHPRGSPNNCQQSRSTRRSELISKTYAVGGLMGNDHIVSLRTGSALVQRRAPALGRRICAPVSRWTLRRGGGRWGLRCTW